MSASANDKITQSMNGGSPVVTTVGSPRSIAGTSLSAVALTNWPTATRVFFTTYKKTTAGLKDFSTVTSWWAIASGTTLGTLTWVGGAADAGNAVGDFIEMGPTAGWAEGIYEHGTAIQNTDGTLKDSIIATAKIADSAISTAKIANDAVVLSKLGPGMTQLLGTGTGAGATLTTSYVDHASLTATSGGGKVLIEWGAKVANGNSGATRNFDIQVLCDGVTTNITPTTLNFEAIYISGVTTNLSYGFLHVHDAPSAASHTWKLQFKASAGGSVVLASNYIKVTEIA